MPNMHFILFAHVAHRLIVLFIHGCTTEDDTFVGMGATLLDGVVVKKHAVVAAGTLVRQNTSPFWRGTVSTLSGSDPKIEKNRHFPKVELHFKFYRLNSSILKSDV